MTKEDIDKIAALNKEIQDIQLRLGIKRAELNEMKKKRFIESKFTFVIPTINLARECDSYLGVKGAISDQVNQYVRDYKDAFAVNPAGIILDRYLMLGMSGASVEDRVNPRLELPISISFSGTPCYLQSDIITLRSDSSGE